MRKRYQKPPVKKPLKPALEAPTNGDQPQDQDPEVDQSQAAKWVWEDEHLIFEGEEEPDEEGEEGQAGVSEGEKKKQPPVPAKTKASHEYFDPAQPRDEQGKFTEWPGHGEHDTALTKELRQVELKVHNDDDESGFLFEPSGKSVWTKKATGEGDKISVTAQEIEHSRKKGNLVFTHNHPEAGTSFSPQDIRMASLMNLKEIRVITKSGGVFGGKAAYHYRMTRPEGGWPEAEKVTSEFRAIHDELKKKAGGNFLAFVAARDATWSVLAKRWGAKFIQTKIAKPEAG